MVTLMEVFNCLKMPPTIGGVIISPFLPGHKLHDVLSFLWLVLCYSVSFCVSIQVVNGCNITIPVIDRFCISSVSLLPSVLYPPEIWPVV